MRAEIERWMEERRQPTGAQPRRLLEKFYAHVGRAARRYPAAYFPERDPGPEGRRAITHELFAVCDGRPLDRRPYAGRVPFRTYVEDDYNDGLIRAHIFYKKPICLLWSLLKQQYAKNVRVEPDLRWRADLFVEVRRVLRARAERVSHPLGERWALPGVAPLRSIPLHQAVDDLRRKELAQDISAVVLHLLGTCGPLSRKQVLDAVNELFPAPRTTDLGEWQANTLTRPVVDDELRLDLRRALASLDDEERAFLHAVVMGLTYQQMVEQFPEWCTSKKRAFLIASRVDTKLLAPLGARLDDMALSPRQLLDIILPVLLDNAGGEA